jgi:sulfate adenylyltransferase subunit 1 (EFTu-like GTPase family)
VLARADQEPPTVGQRFDADIVWMDERPLDPARVYLLKHTAKTVTAEISHALVLNQIGTATVSTARPLVFDRYGANRGTGSFIIIDPSTHFTAGAGMIVNPVREAHPASAHAPVSAAERLALLARHAGSDEEAIEAIRKALEDLLT